MTDTLDVNKIKLELQQAKLELQEAKEEIDDYYKTMQRMKEILTKTANALKGEPEPLRSHDWSDLHVVADKVKKRASNLQNSVDKVMSALKLWLEAMPVDVDMKVSASQLEFHLKLWKEYLKSEK